MLEYIIRYIYIVPSLIKRNMIVRIPYPISLICIVKGQYRILYFYGHFFISVLKTMCDENNSPALICCNIGRDRTGIVAALVQVCLGRSRDEIAEGFAETAVSTYSQCNTSLMSKSLLQTFQEVVVSLNKYYFFIRFHDIWHSGILS